MDPEDRPKTAFTCFMGLYEFNKMPFGLTCAPNVFQDLMNKVLQGADTYAMAYLDDIIVHSRSFEDHTEHSGVVSKTKRGRAENETIKVGVLKADCSLPRSHNFFGMNLSKS